MKNKAFALYLWLILFTTFVSFFSIIIFNYVSGDIRVTKKLIENSKYYQNIRNLAVIATELYRERNGNYVNGEFNSEFSIEGKRYRFVIVRISMKRILIRIFESNKLIARVIVLDREAINAFNLFFKYPIGVSYTVNDGYSRGFSGTNFNTMVTTYEGNIYISDTRINYAYISHNTSINNKSVIYDSDKKCYIYKNLEELQRYSDHVGLVDFHVDSILEAYRNAASKVQDKSRSSRTFPNEVVDLTKYGSIYIFDHARYHLKRARLYFNTINNHNQLIYIHVIDNSNAIQGNIDYHYNYYLVREPMNIRVKSGSTITNDQDIRDIINNNNTNDYIDIQLKPTYPYVYKVLQRIDRGRNEDENKPILTTIYKTNYSNTIIYSNIDLTVGSLGPNNFDGGTINNSIVIFTKDVNVIGNIVYKEFGSIDDFINFADNNTFSFPSNSRSYFSVIANNINIDTTNFTDNYMVLNGDYVAFYDTNSTISLNGYNFSKLYYFGSTCSYRRYLPRNEKIVTDYRDGSNLIKASFNKCKILSVEIVK